MTIPYSRTRTKGALTLKVGKYYHTTAYPNGTPAWGGYLGERSEMQDMVIGKPGWREISRQTRRPVINPMSAKKVFVEVTPTSLYRAYNTPQPTIFGWHDWLKGEVMGLPSGYAGALPLSELFSAYEMEALAVESRTKCLADVGVSLNNWESMAEWRQTRNMVFGPIGRWQKWLDYSVTNGEHRCGHHWVG